LKKQVITANAIIPALNVTAAGQRKSAKLSTVQAFGAKNK